GLDVNLSSGGTLSGDYAVGQITIYTGLIKGTGPLVIAGTGTIRLNTTAATYTGATTINGVFSVSGTANLLPSGTDLTINSGGNFDMQSSQTIASLAGAGTIAPAGGTATLTLTGTASTTYSGVMSGGTSLTVNKSGGTGTLTLSGANTYTGATTISAGTIKLG